MDPFNFADALLGVLAQRLVRTLCKDARKNIIPPGKNLTLWSGPMTVISMPWVSSTMTNLSCTGPKAVRSAANTGYRGRTGIHEIIVGTDPLKSLIQGRAKMEEIREQAIKDGMTTLMQDGIRKVLVGMTDLMQVRKVCIK